MKLALVTGANSGFGMLAAVRLAEEGYRVLAAMRNPDNQAALQKALSERGLSGELDIVQLDVTDLQQVREAAAYVTGKYGRLSVLVNNAGFAQGGFVTDLTSEDWRAQHDTNVLGMFQVTKAFLPLLEAAAPSKIINMGSVSGIIGFPGLSAYSSSKFAVEGLSESLRLELLPRQVYVSVIQPSSYKTNIWEKGLGGIEAGEDAFKRNIIEQAKASALGAGNPEEVARLVAKIAEESSPKLRYPVGKGARQLSILKRFIPWSLIERIAIKKME
ncbi:SDR family oxidoreductase [Bacillus massiliglaciei]|uniref:SDR family oxidoreductase n=1 Tax=Bacillus massiliglaciei TaxID=1816693 RepID=UPI000DA60B21|nr:SDR family oxidoreductase [Bacillus massiliglaciei]